MAENRTCKKCSQNFQISDDDLKFYEKCSPEINGKKYNLLPPTFCPECRQQRRLSFRNERNLYNRQCDLCKKPVITIYSPDKKFTVYCRDCWWSDKWDPLQYGKDFDFKRPFFDQYKELLQVVPKAAVLTYNCENCDYTNYQNDSRNCYLTFGSGSMEDCMYTNWCYEAKDIVDCSFCVKGEVDYQNLDCFQTYHCQYCQDCKNITDCSYCFDCRGCQDCFGCVGLRKKQYHIFNKPYSKEGYEKFLQEVKKPENKARVLAEVQKLKMTHPHLSNRITKSENCSGDDIENSKNSHECFGVKDLYDCKFCYDVLAGKDLYDCNRTGDNELTYEVCGGGYYKFSQFIYFCDHLSFCHYVLECMNSDHLFGCNGVHNKKYVILNKQYTQAEYETLLPQILEYMQKTGEWGEYFPSSLSTFGYNETLANDYYPLDKQQALAKGFNWSDYEQPFPTVKTLKASELDAKGYDEDIITMAVECEVTKKPFKITKQELAFYRKNSLPLPKKHPNQRYKERMALQNPRKFYDRTCAKCQKTLRSIYAPNRPEIVYCEACYLAAVY